ncbi:hypothetical protein QA639_33530 [Bradyrhizobium pachyrhizi]|uniref:hypothetical protein n=1 Tax=Bradyrhizobium pachyrhizi TaxID=280333 RepID=UPI0024B215B7|nr:hypothetical protein [Bradyrhizobium pachyrhizi]WFU54497.1 hypothetical protein QA639_33530 [Bradyrhizobium pachyrhizi]
MTVAARLPDAASLETVLAGLGPASADADLIPALTIAFPGFAFGIAPIDDDYWRDTRSVLRPDGTRLGELRPWMIAELAKENGDVTAVWERLKEIDLQITEWRGTSVFVSAPTGPGVADYVQIALGREIEWRAGPIVNPNYRQQRVIREVGPQGTRETSFLEAVPDFFDFVPRELRFFRDWEESSAGPQHIFANWALDARDYTHKSEREVGFIPRPLKPPKERLLTTGDISVHALMDRIEAVDREVGLPFGWFFLMTHGHWVDPDVGHAIAEGLKAQRVRLPDPDARVLLRWADRTYGF